MIARELELPKNNSFFLFGPRGSGKSTLLRELFSETDALWINLLDTEQETSLLLNPNSLIDLWRVHKKKWVVIDEVQKVPRLLDVVHNMIESHKIFFALTGSSARKLKRGQANLLAGRAWSFHLYPFSHSELSTQFDLNSALHFGMLPKVWELENEKDKLRFLKSYADTYVREEIQIEQIVRALEPFRKFLPVAALSQGRPLSFSKIADEAKISPKSCERYFQILSDTLLGFFIDHYHSSVRKRQRQVSKFYFFDCGIQRALAGTLAVKLVPQTSYYGEMFETFVINEILKARDYAEKDDIFSYLSTHDGSEIDLLIERANKVIFLIEIKSSNSVSEKNVKTLSLFKKDFQGARALCLCQETRARQLENGIEILPWQDGIREIYSPSL